MKNLAKNCNNFKLVFYLFTCYVWLYVWELCKPALPVCLSVWLFVCLFVLPDVTRLCPCGIIPHTTSHVCCMWHAYSYRFISPWMNRFKTSQYAYFWAFLIATIHLNGVNGFCQSLLFDLFLRFHVCVCLVNVCFIENIFLSNAVDFWKFWLNFCLFKVFNIIFLNFHKLQLNVDYTKIWIWMGVSMCFYLFFSWENFFKKVFVENFRVMCDGKLW